MRLRNIDYGTSLTIGELRDDPWTETNDPTKDPYHIPLVVKIGRKNYAVVDFEIVHSEGKSYFVIHGQN